MILKILLAVMMLAGGRLWASDVYLQLMAHGQRMDIGIAGFMAQTPALDESKYARQIQEVLLHDMLFARYFNILEDGPVYSGKESELVEWVSRGAEILVCGKIKLKKNEIMLTGQILDIVSRKVIWEKVFQGTTENYRRLAHELNDELVLRFTGERGIAHTRIVFANNATGHKELYTLDYDGSNLMRLTEDRSINILPCWSPDGKEILYTTYRFANPDLYSISSNGDGRRAVSKRQGLNTAACFSPDGSKIVLTLSQGRTPNLYVISRSGEMDRQLTFGRNLVTSPSFAPNGHEVIYISDEPGYPQLFIRDIDGGNVRRLPARGYCDSPAWSPRGDRIVFAMRQSRDDNRYDLYMYDLSSSKITRLTQNEGDNENPSWSPDGRFIVFSSTRSGRSELYIVAADGSGARKLGNIPGKSVTPDWSP